MARVRRTHIVVVQEAKILADVAYR